MTVIVWSKSIENNTHSQPFQVANLFRRLAALVYDSFLLFAITLGYGALLLIVKIIFNGVHEIENIQPGPVIQWVSLFGWLVCVVGYYYFCWRKQGQTLGMKAWRLRLQQHNGTLPTPQQCLMRSLLASLSMACLGIGYLWQLLPDSNGCLHDKLSHTDVVLVKE